jgi:hypothetical protein
MRRTYVLALVLIAATFAATAPVSAHPQAHPATAAPSPAPLVAPAALLSEVLTAAAPLPETPWAMLVALAVLMPLLAWCPRRVVALALVVVVAILAFETGIHSTHHLGQPGEAARCVVAGVSSGLSADVVDTAHDLPRAVAAETRVAALAPPVVIARAVAPDAGRAPPSLSA